MGLLLLRFTVVEVVHKNSLMRNRSAAVDLVVIIFDCQNIPLRLFGLPNDFSDLKVVPMHFDQVGHKIG